MKNHIFEFSKIFFKKDDMNNINLFFFNEDTNMTMIYEMRRTWIETDINYTEQYYPLDLSNEIVNDYIVIHDITNDKYKSSKKNPHNTKIISDSFSGTDTKILLDNDYCIVMHFNERALIEISDAWNALQKATGLNWDELFELPDEEITLKKLGLEHINPNFLMIYSVSIHESMLRHKFPELFSVVHSL